MHSYCCTAFGAICCVPSVENFHGMRSDQQEHGKCSHVGDASTAFITSSIPCPRASLPSCQIRKFLEMAPAAVETEVDKPSPAVPDFLLDPDAVLKDTGCKWRSPFGKPPDYSKTRAYYEESESNNALKKSHGLGFHGPRIPSANRSQSTLFEIVIAPHTNAVFSYSC